MAAAVNAVGHCELSCSRTGVWSCVVVQICEGLAVWREEEEVEARRC